MAHSRHPKTEATPALPVAQLKSLATQLYQHFHKQDDPPADEIYVPIDLIKADDEAENSFFATVRFITTYVERKVHSIRIKFKLEGDGASSSLVRANLKTIKYV